MPAWSVRAEKSQQVLMLYSWHKDMPWQLAFEQGLRQELAALGQPIQLYAEYLDTGRFPEAVQQEALSTFLKAKYASTPLDLIIAESYPAITFCRTSPDLFPGVRQILLQTDRQFGGSVTDAEKDEWVVTIGVDFDRGVSEMLRLINPDTLFVIADTSETDGVNRLNSFQETLQREAQGLRAEFLLNLPLDTLLDKVSCLPDNSAIYYLLVFHDGHGQALTPFQAVQKIAEQANAPVFSHWETLMGSGIVGGYLLSGRHIGAITAHSIRAHAQGEPFYFYPQEAYGSYYDWEQLRAWGIDTNKLPEDAILLNYAPSVWEQYQGKIMYVALFLSVLLLVLLSLVCYWRNTRKGSALL